MKYLSLVVGIFVLAAGLIVSFPAAHSASAAPAGAAAGLKVTAESCSNGLASYRLTWTPSGKGAQRIDLSATDNGFANNFSSGNLDVNASLVFLTSLKQDTTYYVRIVTGSTGGNVASDTLSFKAACVVAPPFTVPTQLHSSQVGKGTTRFQWTAGQGNQHFCVDTAYKVSDLVNLTGSWRNHGCGTSSTSLDVSDLRCDAIVYWRVFAWGSGSGHSQVAVANTPSCVIGAPTNLSVKQADTKGSVVLSWAPGANNRWFCVDVADSTSDLANHNGSWRNYGCWMTGSSIQINNLDCGDTFYWNVYAWNDYTNTRSANASFEVKNCTKTVEADIDDLDIVKTGTRYYAEIVAVVPNACHEPAETEVERSGSKINITVTYVTEPGNCQYFAGTYDLSVNLGSGLDKGRTYKVTVNDQLSKTFVPN